VLRICYVNERVERGAQENQCCITLARHHPATTRPNFPFSLTLPHALPVARFCVRGKEVLISWRLV